MRHQRFDERIEIALDEIGEIIERHFDAMIGDAILREIVSADFFAAFAGADLLFTLRGVFRVFFRDFSFEQARAQDRHSLGPVFYLRSLIGNADGQSTWLVLNLNGGIGGVDALTAFTRG